VQVEMTAHKPISAMTIRLPHCVVNANPPKTQVILNFAQ
jgi:hypothetical protein